MDKASETGNNSTEPNESIPIPTFSEAEAEILAKKLNSENTHREAQQVLISWMLQGECNGDNSSIFFTLIKSCFDYLQKLKEKEKECLEEVVKKKSACLKFHYDFTKTENAFKAIEKQDIWESLTPSQKDNIQIMKNDFLELAKNKFSNSSNAVKKRSAKFENNVYELNTEISNLTSKLHSIHKETKVMEERCKKKKKEIFNLKLELESRKKRKMSQEQENSVEATFGCNPDCAHMNEMQIVSLITVLLYYNQSALNIDSIYSHLKESIPYANKKEIDFVLRKFPNLFKEIGSEQDSKWIYIGLSI
ncbi:unnamed protein product [Larinioides sclopetarius]|uniref:Uncharacterized protein n=1 Tax=Larinioides sclopetarius TaxID=280406 RepID=A0AAV2A0Q9_9ARAC